MNKAQDFLDYCNAMRLLAFCVFEKELAKYGLVKYEIGDGIDCLGEPHPVGKKWLTEPYSIHAKARNFQSGEDETIQITICPSEGWKPTLYVASTSFDPVVFETTHSAEKDIVLMEKQIQKCFARLRTG